MAQSDNESYIPFFVDALVEDLQRESLQKIYKTKSIPWREKEQIAIKYLESNGSEVNSEWVDRSNLICQLSANGANIIMPHLCGKYLDIEMIKCLTDLTAGLEETDRKCLEDFTRKKSEDQQRNSLLETGISSVTSINEENPKKINKLPSTNIDLSTLPNSNNTYENSSKSKNTSMSFSQSPLSNPDLKSMTDDCDNAPETNDNDHQEFSSKSKNVNYVNILVTGENGIGKSTFINGIANYLRFTTAQDAFDGDIQLPARMFLQTAKKERQVQKIGSNIEFNSKNVIPKTNVHEIPSDDKNIVYRLIETPALPNLTGTKDGDLETDAENVRLIHEQIRSYGAVHAICILLNHSYTKYTIAFRSTIDVILDNFPHHNFLYCFPRSASKFFQPPELVSIANSYMKENGRTETINGSNAFYFDNEEFLSIIIRKLGKKPPSSIYTDCWKKTREVMIDMLKQISTMEAVAKLPSPELLRHQKNRHDENETKNVTSDYKSFSNRDGQNNYSDSSKLEREFHVQTPQRPAVASNSSDELAELRLKTMIERMSPQISEIIQCLEHYFTFNEETKLDKISGIEDCAICRIATTSIFHATNPSNACTYYQRRGHHLHLPRGYKLTRLRPVFPMSNEKLSLAKDELDSYYKFLLAVQMWLKTAISEHPVFRKWIPMKDSALVLQKVINKLSGERFRPCSIYSVRSMLDTLEKGKLFGESITFTRKIIEDHFLSIES